MVPGNPVYKLRMIRDDLEGLPHYPLPEGWHFRPYEQGDESQWIRIQSGADAENTISIRLFSEQFGHDPVELARRQIYICPTGVIPAGTATAWFAEAPHSNSMGRLHWVAVHPDWQGRGLARPLIAAACHRLRELGHTSAYLSTSSSRARAIRLYFEFGFKPWIQSAKDEKSWNKYFSSAGLS